VRRGLGAGLLISAGLLVVGCGGSDDGGADGAEQQTLTVFAAASLTDTFTELGARFEQAHPGTEVRLSFAGSSDLATQLLEGAPADVFASANPEQLARVADAGLLEGEPVVFAANVLQLAVPPGNPADIGGLADLDADAAGADVDLVVCAPQVPCGDAAERVAQVAGVELAPVSEEPSVTSVLDKVRAGQADVGLVYVTDVAAADGEVDGIDVPEAAQVVNVYPIAAITTGEPEPDGEIGARAGDFVAFVLGPDGQAVLRSAAFLDPPS
jgi:molybdate transport system substrate-binding protein